MTSTVLHAQSSTRIWGGCIEDYLPIHNWFDETKKCMGDFRHRALRHHAFGIFECEEKFGPYITNSDGRVVPTRYVGEQHVLEDCGGRIPSVEDWLECLSTKSWMAKAVPAQLKHGTRGGRTHE